jgi:hypothetical protein
MHCNTTMYLFCSFNDYYLYMHMHRRMHHEYCALSKTSAAPKGSKREQKGDAKKRSCVADEALLAAQDRELQQPLLPSFLPGGAKKRD